MKTKMCDNYKISVLLMTLLLGGGTVGSYVPIIKGQLSGKGTDFWAGMNPNPSMLFYTLQGLAAAGYLTYFTDFMTDKTKSKQKKIAVTILIGILLASALGWGVSVQTTTMKWIVSGSLIVTALASIGLLVVESIPFENEPPSKPYNIVSLTLLCVVTVIVDAIFWNKSYLS